jgi:transposase
MERRCSQKEAGVELGLSDRQVRRMLERFKSEGTQGIRRKYKGGNRSFKGDFKAQVIRLVKEHYHDFGPKFTSKAVGEFYDYITTCSLIAVRSRTFFSPSTNP